MTVTVKSWDRIDPLLTEWERLAVRAEASPFLWPGWIGAWWRAFGAGKLEILTVYEDGDLTGVLPLHRLRGVLSSTNDPDTGPFGFLAANETALQRLCEYLFSERARRINFSLLPSSDVGVSLARTTAEAAGYRVIADSIAGSPYVLIDETSWDAYQSGLGKSMQKDIRRCRRRLEEEGRLTIDVFDGTQRLDELLEEGFRVEGSGWKEAEGTNINARPSTRRFYTEVAHWAAERGWLRLAFLRLDGRTLAFDYCLECNRIHYLIKTGYDPAHARYSPGKVLRQHMLARAFSEGLAIYDFGGIIEPYKQKWTDSYRELRSLYMFAPTALGFLDRKALEYRRPAVEQVKGVARSALGKRGWHLLKRGRALARARLDL
jgi:CelD/BcsL family acetyltransferase involved in cellulose biosynthesis